jgi:hypothetical protein
MGGRVHVVFGNCLEDGLEIALELCAFLQRANELFEGKFFFSLAHKNNNRTKLNIIHSIKEEQSPNIKLELKKGFWETLFKVRMKNQEGSFYLDNC